MSIILAALAFVQPATPPVGERTAPPGERLVSGAILIPDEDQDPLIAAAAAYPLGSAQNPVRVGGPEGEAAYLGRLRCPDGSSPRIGPRSDAGQGAFGSMVSGYALACAGAAPVTLILDMYHAEHREDRAPPGFTIAGR